MSTQAVLTTIQLNNIGVCHFECGRIDLAISCFVDALRTSKRVFPNTEFDEGCGLPVTVQRDEKLVTDSLSILGLMDVEEDVQEVNLVDDFLNTSPVWAINGLDQSASGQLDSQEHRMASESFFYQHTFKFPDEGLGEGERPALYSLTCMFNLAIAYHARATNSPDEDSNFLVALRLYELTFTLQAIEDLDLGTLVTLAILNNLGQINKRLNNETNAKRCFENLLASIFYLIDEAHAIADFQEIVRLFFSIALSELILSHPLTAPSA